MRPKTTSIPRLPRQICILYFLEVYYENGKLTPGNLKKEVETAFRCKDNNYNISMRTIERDIKELRDCGLTAKYYDYKYDSYMNGEPCAIDLNNYSKRKRANLLRLKRLGNVFFKLPSLDPYDYYDYIEEIAEIKDYDDLKKKYYEICSMVDPSITPEKSERTRQRDFKIINEIPFMHIKYLRRIRNYIFTINPDELNNW